MAYRVDISPSALQDAEDAYFWIKQQRPERAGEWYEGLLEKIFSLENLPTRCPLAPESKALVDCSKSFFTNWVRDRL